MLLVTATEAPPPGAAAVNVIVHAEVSAPVTAAGLQTKPLIWDGAGVTLTEAVVEAPFAVAVIVTGVAADTLEAVAAKAAVVLPADTLTEAGTVRAALLSETATG